MKQQEVVKDESIQEVASGSQQKEIEVEHKEEKKVETEQSQQYSQETDQLSKSKSSNGIEPWTNVQSAAVSSDEII